MQTYRVLFGRFRIVHHSLKRLQMEIVWASGCNLHGQSLFRARHRGNQTELLYSALRQLKGCANINLDVRRFIIRITQYQDTPARCPRRPSIDLMLARIAAYPMGIHEYICVGSLPFRAGSQYVPLFVRQALRGNVEFLQACSTPEKRPHFVRKILGVVVHQCGRAVGAMDYPLGHEGIQGI